MEQRERADQRAVGLDEFPAEALRAVECDGEIEAVVDHEAVVAHFRTLPRWPLASLASAARAPDVIDRERRHGGALIELDRMAQDPVAEVVAPGQRGRG